MPATGTEPVKRKPVSATVMMTCRVTESEAEAYRAAAEREGRTVSNWLRWIANRATTLEES